MNNKTALVLHENPWTKHFDITNAHHDGPILSWFIILLDPMKKVRIPDGKKKKCKNKMIDDLSGQQHMKSYLPLTIYLLYAN